MEKLRLMFIEYQKQFYSKNNMHDLIEQTDQNRAVLDGKYDEYLLSIVSLPVSKELIPLTEMSVDHFSQIFIQGFAPMFMKEKIAEFWSLQGFHNAIADYGKFGSYRTAVELGYDVEFTLSN